MTKRRSTLTGSWSGAYRYANDAMPETVFNAQIEEDDAGSFVGLVREPSFLHPNTSTVLDADVQGAREGETLTFLKIYRVYDLEVITYDGKVDGAFEHIVGTWDIPGRLSGSFFMTRDSEAPE